MIREPQYEVGAEEVLDQLEACSDERLLNAVVNAIELILDRGDEPEARRKLVTGENGQDWFEVRVRDSRHDWVIFWRPEGAVARIAYIGSF